MRESVIVQAKMASIKKSFTNDNLYTLQIQIILLVFITSAQSQFQASYLPPKYCPSGSVGTYPNCKCQAPFIGVPPNCRAPEYLPPDSPKCPEGYYGKYPNCHEPCPPYHIGYQPDCVRMACLPGYKGEYQPDCIKVDCSPGEIGLYPFCVTPTTAKYYEVKECPDGQTGTPPNCRAKCPSFTNGEPPNCKKIKCPDGWEGDYQPNCRITPKCPKDKDGKWPNCVSRYCPAGSIGTYPNCKCRPGTIGTPPNCKVMAGSPSPPKVGYLPPTDNKYLPPYITTGYLPSTA